MPLYAYRCPAGHEFTALGSMRRHKTATCSCGKTGEYDFGLTTRASVPLDDSMGGAEKDAIYWQTGKRFRNIRDFNRYCEKKGLQPYHKRYGDPIVKAQKTEEQSELASLQRDTRKIWADVMTERV